MFNIVKDRKGRRWIEEATSRGKGVVASYDSREEAEEHINRYDHPKVVAVFWNRLSGEAYSSGSPSGNYKGGQENFSFVAEFPFKEGEEEEAKQEARDLMGRLQPPPQILG